MLFSTTPAAQGLYNPDHDVDSCGVAVVVDIQGRRSHSIVSDALLALENLEHRGAIGADPGTGDGAGILLQLPIEFLASQVDFPLPEPNAQGHSTFAAGNVFLPQDPKKRALAIERVEKIAVDEGLITLGWRDIPLDITSAGLGSDALSCLPHMMQYFVTAPESHGVKPAGLDLDRLIYPLRKRCENLTDEVIAEDSGLYFTSLSARTMVYKGMLTTMQLPKLYLDLQHTAMKSALAIVHSRFSTNTFPSWSLAHPFHYIAHNGEINTVRGNRNRMRAREAMLYTNKIPGDISRCFPINTPDASDSQSLDQVLELLVLAGRSLPHAVMTLIPEPWENNPRIDPALRAFYQYHSSLMEPWDGPACVTFTDGVLIGAVLDRNGLRPGRWWRTKDDRIILASESGVLRVPEKDICAKGRLEPGKMFLVDTDAGRIISNEEIKSELAAKQPYQEWLDAGLFSLKSVPDKPAPHIKELPIVTRQQVFGFTEEDLRLLLLPAAATGAEPMGSMGTDAPIAVMSTRPRLLFDYFSEMFAQVTNPPLDAIREEIVTSLHRTMGPEQNLLYPTAASCRQIKLSWPVLTNAELDKIIHINASGNFPGFSATILRALFPVADGGAGLEKSLEQLCENASRAIAQGYRTLVISDRLSDKDHAPIPSLLAVSAVHHHLVRTKERTKVAFVVESGDAREVHHIAMLLGFGAAAVNPYLAIESIEQLVKEGELTGIEASRAVYNFIKGMGKGVLKVMSKMGISTVASYTGAQAFEAIGISKAVIDQYFTRTKSQLGGIGLDEIAHEVALRNKCAYPDNSTERAHRRLGVGGDYQYRREGELHLFTPETVFLLQHSTRSGRADIFAKYCQEVDKLSRQGGTLRGLFQLREGIRPAVDLDEVEPVESIISRFNTGAMSYGSISAEAHETIALAMNRLGGRSNSGEGGETADRLHDPMRRSAVKQIASGRFGVTSGYLINASDLQIKMAQGAKPGEGGQLPGYKVYPWIAKTRHSTPGVTLISPPPHHDIYSIEDLKQLIHDLKNANPQARIHVKLVSAVGVGTVATGVSKCHADVVLISGHDGGTGASPLTSLKHAGTPWEIGLADAQQTLVINGLRDRITVQCDGGLRTARDVIVAALLGAEEFGFSTAPLVVSGCIMMRVCHLDTCPVGVATQNPVLRDRFNGKVEYLVNFFTFIAEEVRKLLASLGFHSIDEAVGRVDVLDTAEGVNHWKNKGLDLSQIFHIPTDPVTGKRLHQRRRTRGQNHGLEAAVDQILIREAEPALEDALPVVLRHEVTNVNRTVGTMLGSAVTRRYGSAGLAEDTIMLKLSGSAGQSLGAFLPKGITIDLKGDANDYVGKGLSGGKIILAPGPDASFAPEDHVIAGNTLLYGATSGELYARGQVGERFAVRNSGAIAVVEGIGDHGLEYMTGGKVVILGKTGRNLAAGMSGGIAYVVNLHVPSVNTAMVDICELEPEDVVFLREVIEKHYLYTQSTIANSLLDDWSRRIAAISKIMPTDYARVLETARIAEAEGLDVDEAVMEVARG